MNNCTKCHDLGNQVSDRRCLDCHKNIRQLISEKRGYHSHSKVKSKSCRDCHSEHFGRDFKLIKFSEKTFDHNDVQFRLTGKHINTECGKCHTDLIRRKLNRKSKTYLGLSSDCMTCHEDIHQGTLGTNCISCHSTNSYKTAEYFDHNKADFKLLQAHTKVSCEKCHQKIVKNGKSFQKFTGLSFTNCYPCHNDVHNNKFGKDCKGCHVVAGFKFVNKNAFDHGRTKFPLLGKHSEVSCNSCHKASITVKPAFEKCTDCHKDYHSGEFTVNGEVKECSGCHNLEGFTPSLFTVKDHSKLNFPLEGKHLAVGCRECHIKESKWHFRLSQRNCADCHINIHKNEIPEDILKNGCESCHNVQAWASVKFDHSLTGYILSGKHLALGCRKCHFEESDNAFYFKTIKSDCESCHKDKHNGQFRINNLTDCTRCHTSEGWKPASVDHNLSRFKLDGKHNSVPCNKCHPVVYSNGSEYIRYKQEDIRCSACHS